MKKIALGSDHGGYELKLEVKKHLKAKGYEVLDFGTDSGASVDYPDIAKPACASIIDGKTDCGILICGTGIGISMAANKIKGIRAALCHNVWTTKLTREHNDANVLCMGGRVLGPGIALDMVDTFLNTEFEGGRHANRVNKIEE